ncbi:MAG: iron ABC transporter substrate-binding protein [Candidatus Syntrophoarchaeum caldarius]|uniref:Iron ABC transporter substrate-binding protein n=1 Tax=Candidatus Syntropharchaeum caldarium TaxID=1838285 RepID=A0A1F2P983_9EURY|nr:MAG: iron ABC transporter substrate-binding protein [Candidatus Syntrophoarchaeum caldarius]
MRRNNKLFVILIILAIIATSAAGCMEKGDVSTSSKQDHWMVVTDELNREVVIPQKPQRIVSLAPSTTEILFAIGAGDRVVGVDDYSNYPPEATHLVKVGSYATINIEQVVDLKPDLVVAAYGNGIEVIDALSNLGIPVVGLNPGGLDEILDSINLLGKITGCEENATRLTDEMRARIVAVESMAATKDKPSVFYVIWHDPLWTAGNGTFEDEMISIAGGKNIASDLDSYSIISLEKVIDSDPDVIITTSGGGMGVAGSNLSYEYITTNPRFAGISAVKEGKVYVIDADIATRPGPRIVDALEEIYRCIHDDANSG